MFENFKHAKRFLKHHQFASNFCGWNFASNTTYPKHKIDNPNYCVPMVIFQRYKNIYIFLTFSIPIVAPFITFSCFKMFKILLEFSKKSHIKIALLKKNPENPIFLLKKWQILLKKINTSLEKLEALKPMKWRLWLVLGSFLFLKTIGSKYNIILKDLTWFLFKNLLSSFQDPSKASKSCTK